MTSTPSMGFGVVGVAGFASAALTSVQLSAKDAHPAAHMVAIVGHDPQRNAERIAELRAQGLRIIDSFEQLLADPKVEAVWLPVPIHLHRPMTEQALAAGKFVLCEKPVAGCIDDLRAMQDAEKRTGRPSVLIGYQDMYDPTVWQAKKLLLDGVIGKLQRATLIGCWPRANSYFNRSSWPGKIRIGDAWVLDSPANNALAHYLNLSLFFLGAAPSLAATPVQVEAELYRVNPIENYDTCSIRTTVESGAQLLTLLTHAATENLGPEIEVHGDKGRLRRTDAALIFEDNAGNVIQSLPRLTNEGIRVQMMRRVVNYFRGIPDDSSHVGSLETCAPHLITVNGASEAASVVEIPAEFRVNKTLSNGSQIIVIPGIDQAFRNCAASGKMLHESKQVPWSTPSGSRDLRGYRHFAGPAGYAVTSASAN